MTAKSFFFVKQEKLVFPVEIKCAFLKKRNWLKAAGVWGCNRRKKREWQKIKKSRFWPNAICASFYFFCVCFSKILLSFQPLLEEDYYER
ncbi:unnamed protein product [Meloidogyne enterolobii]|uniref:Uncharacterized protein n=1 Tax=Meloidogyne enterolobii TaxID=390850 RepID=A0ACB1ASW2_MELEN